MYPLDTGYYVQQWLLKFNHILWVAHRALYKTTAETCLTSRTAMDDPRFRYDREAIVQAYKDVKENGMSVNGAARLYGVPRTVLRRRLDGSVSVDLKQVTLGGQPKLNQEEEGNLAQHLNDLARCVLSLHVNV